ncbi:restriction endonuclease subunit S [Litoribacter ruber]|uniref:restriction endonuclease subunit S n=1 Tax=Litoribacter ruber TaxID=702568 RepID=UPI001BD99F67|nr:restriction endonuclease subunit S [Litoribacter ruber]MBT0810145.1 restriction endonuclease subunit S [Litoribacter ruber]
MSKLKTYKFSNLYRMSSGISSRPEQAGHGAPFLSFSTAFNNYFLPENLPDLMDTSEKEKTVYSIKSGDIFLTRTSETLDELGMSSVAIKDYEMASFSGFLKRLRPTQEDITYPKYMAFYLRSKLFRKTMTNNAIMTLRASLNEQIFSYLDLVLPEFEEQKKIGDFLFQLNSKIDLNNKINTELEGMAKLIYDYWFVQFDFPISVAQAQAMGNPALKGKPYKSSGGKMVWNKELKREVPEGWAKGKLKDVLDFNYGKPLKKEVRSGSGFPVVGSGGIVGYHNKALVKGPGIVVGRKGTVGNITYLYTDFFPIDTSYYVEPKDNLEIQYFYFLLNTLGLQMMNSDSAVPGLNRERALGTDILICDNKLVQKFNQTVSPFFKKASQLLEENEQLASLRDWLLPMLMNGQVKVGEQYPEGKEELSVAAEPEVGYGGE